LCFFCVFDDFSRSATRLQDTRTLHWTVAGWSGGGMAVPAPRPAGEAAYQAAQAGRSPEEVKPRPLLGTGPSLFPPPQAVGWRTIIGLPIPWWRFRPNWEKRHELFPYSRFQTVVITFETSTSILEQDQKVLVATSVGVPNETPRESTILHSGNKNASRFRPTLWIWSCTSFPLK